MGRWKDVRVEYATARPTYNTATDCRWRGVFGNVREVITFEAKIEHDGGKAISATDVGQAHNQYNRALEEYRDNGYVVRAAIVTHLTAISDDAKASVGPLRVAHKDTVLQLWQTVRAIMSIYRDKWSLYDIDARSRSAQLARAKLPAGGWLTRALSGDEQWVTMDVLLADWKVDA